MSFFFSELELLKKEFHNFSFFFEGLIGKTFLKQSVVKLRSRYSLRRWNSSSFSDFLIYFFSISPSFWDPLVSYYYSVEFTPCKAEQPLWTMGLQKTKKKYKKIKAHRKSVYKESTDKRCQLILDLKPFRS